MATFERESMYQMLAARDWTALAAVLVKHVKELQGDPVAAQAVCIFEAEYFNDMQGYKGKVRYRKFEDISVMIELGKHGFSKAFIDRFIDEKLALMQELEMPSALSYALNNQHRPLAQQMIKDRQARLPEQVADARRGDVRVKATPVQNSAPKLLNLFKSKQEENFFEAVRRVFPTYNPYPNVALSSVLDIDAFKGALSPQELSYFYRAVVDSVVFDARDSYRPRYFFELDSIHHDTARAVENDRMKDAIFKAANVKLIRIRGFTGKVLSIQEFETLVLDVMETRA